MTGRNIKQRRKNGRIRLGRRSDREDDNKQTKAKIGRREIKRNRTRETELSVV